MKEQKPVKLGYNRVIQAYNQGIISLNDFRSYIKAANTYKKLRKRYEKNRVSNEELMEAFTSYRSIKFIENVTDNCLKYEIVIAKIKN